MSGKAELNARKVCPLTTKKMTLAISDHYNLHDVKVELPLKRLTAVTGFSGAGKTSLILDSLVPAIKAKAKGESLPAQVSELESPIKDVVSVDASPIGKSTRSTTATYTSIMDNLRKLFATVPLAKERHYTPSYLPRMWWDWNGDFRYPVFAGYGTDMSSMYGPTVSP